MVVVHLTASTFFGGPERQMLGLARRLAPRVRSVLVSFSEGGRCQPFLDRARTEGHEAIALGYDTPRLFRSISEIAAVLEDAGAGVLCCHGYKADLLGHRAARRRGIPVVAVSRGWTRESLKVRFYEWLDRVNLRWMDRVVCVSEGQAEKVRRAGVAADNVTVIRNAIDPERFLDLDLRYCQRLHDFFPRPRRAVIGSAGRLSPEKGFELFLEAAIRLSANDPTLGFVHFGDGPMRAKMVRRIEETGMRERFILAGLRADLDRFMPFLDLLVLPSYTEGLPNVVLEAFAASVPVVATAVGGTPEVVEDGVSGLLVPPGDVGALAAGIVNVLADEDRRQVMGQRGYRRVVEHFSFDAQARDYESLFEQLTPATLSPFGPEAEREERPPTPPRERRTA